MSRAPFQVLVLPYRRCSNGTVEYALFRRADRDAWQGIAGGGQGLETPNAAAVRELFEEANITPTEPLVGLASLGAIPVEHFRDRESWPPELETIPEYAFGVDVGYQPIRLSAEHVSMQWMSFSDAHARLTWESNRAALREIGVMVVRGLAGMWVLGVI